MKLTSKPRRYMREGHVWTADDCADFVRDRNSIRAKHRVMTMREYDMWRVTGDSVSSPSEANPFPGGLTIKLDENGFFDVIGDAID